jgi:adenylate cyclase
MNTSSETSRQTPVARVSTKTSKSAMSLLSVLGALLPTLFITFLNISSPPVLNGINLKIYDYFLLSVPTTASSNAPLIVDIDEKSLQKYGQWPWPRFLLAQLLKRIQHDQPLAVGLDIILSEPDRTSLVNIYKNIKDYFGVTIDGIKQLPDHIKDNDSHIASVLREGNFVTSLYFTFNGTVPDRPCNIRPLNIGTQYVEGATEKDQVLIQADGVISSLPIFKHAAMQEGFLNVEADADGILRRAPLLISYQGKLYPHLSLATLLAAHPPKTLLFKVSQYGSSGLVMDGRFIPLDSHGKFAVSFHPSAGSSSRPFEYISAADLLSGNIPAKKFTNKIVFLGTSAVGLNDLHHMPGDNILPGVQFHANIVDNILSDTFLYDPPWRIVAELGLVIIIGVTIALLFFRFGAWTAFLMLILGTIALFCLSKQFFFSSGIFISPLYPILLLLFNFSLIYPIKFYRSERRRRAKKKEFELMQEAILEIITTLTETRDQATGGHIRRTQRYLLIMTEALQQTEKYKKILTAEEIEVICKVAPLHDVGKIGVPDNILLKPDKLSSKEFEEIKKHTYYGKEIIEAALHRVGSNYFLEKALEIVYTHQEKWDGTGYPQGLSGENIPLSGRVMAIADVYDALTSKRSYKVPVTHEEAVAIMEAGKGTHFDPELIEVFLKEHERFREISTQYDDLSL